MNYLIIHYFFMICICSRRISGYSMKNTNSYDIDDFINQLLSSQKFDELADIVAEKAVKKIKNLPSGDHILGKILANKHSSELGDQEKVKIHDSNEGEGRKKVDNESLERRPKKIHHDDYDNPKHAERAGETHKDESDKAKINTEALMKKEAKSEEAELSLKYKYLKKHARDEKERNHKNADYSERNPWTHLDHPKPKAQYFVPVVDDKRHADGAHHSMNSDSIENSNVKRNKKQTSRYARGKYKNDETNDDDLDSRPKFKSQRGVNPPVTDIVQNGENNNKPEALETIKNSHEDVKEVDENKPKRTSKVDVIWRSHDGQLDKSENEEDGKASTTAVLGYELGELTTKRLIRREGDRFYTYLSGAEYADFHEEMRKEEQKKKSDQLF